MIKVLTPILIFILIAILPCRGYAQQKGLVKFIPAGYEILDSASGNLNLDSYGDMVLVLNLKGEDTIYNDAPKRPVLILIGNPKGEYILASRNDNVVNTHDMGMFETFSEIQTGLGSFSIHHAGGLSLTKFNQTHTFKYDSTTKKWMLEKDEQYFTNIQYFDDTDSMQVNKTSDIKTVKDFGKITFENFDPSKNYK